MIKFWQQHAKQILLSVISSLLVAALFAVYMFWIGIPKTTVRNLYNQAIIEVENGNQEEAYQLLQDAYDIWPEDYIAEKITVFEPLITQ